MTPESTLRDESNDAAVASLWSRSACGAALARVVDGGEAAWKASRSCALLWSVCGPVIGSRQGLAATVAIAAVTALALQRLVLKPEPVTWVVPLAVLTAALVVLGRELTDGSANR